MYTDDDGGIYIGVELEDLSGTSAEHRFEEIKDTGDEDTVIADRSEANNHRPRKSSNDNKARLSWIVAA